MDRPILSHYFLLGQLKLTLGHYREALWRISIRCIIKLVCNTSLLYSIVCPQMFLKKIKNKSMDGILIQNLF